MADQDTTRSEANPAAKPACKLPMLQVGADAMTELLSHRFEVVPVHATSTAAAPKEAAPGGQDARSEQFSTLQRRLERVEEGLLSIGLSLADSLVRIADALAPEPADIVGTPYVAGKLGCTTVWIAEMVRSGEIPKCCIVPGTGNGKPWKFYRAKIDRWLQSR
jgi:hypothetical protein